MRNEKKQVAFGKKVSLNFRSNEAFKTLRTNIQFSGNSIRTIVLTSCVPNEGKSTVSFQLAISFSQVGKKVLYIDADIRKSVMVGRYKIDRNVLGLSHYLTGQRKLEEIVYESDIENLDIIFTGPVTPNPAELLDSAEFAEMLSALRTEYDYIIIDAPPLGSVIDAAVIAKNCDGAIFVIENNSISYKLAQKVKAQLEKSGCRILGAVLNKVDMEKKGYYGNYYGKYYGKYYGRYE